MHYLYILESLQTKKYYIGESSDIEARLQKHTSGQTSFGKRNKHIIVVFKRECKDRSEARKLELFLKRQKSRSFIKRFIEGKIIPP